MTRVLVVEDEESFSDALSLHAAKEGFDVAVAADGPAALAEFERHGADLVLLDLMLPGLSGTEVCRALRAAVVGSGHHADRPRQRDRQGRRARAGRGRLRHQAVLGPRAGRPDPGGAAPAQRAARSRRPPRWRPARCGWTSSGTSSPSTAAQVPLPLKEFELLEMLLRNAGRVLTRGQLIDRVWGADYVGDTKTLDVHVKRLRAKIEQEPGNPRHLVTVRGLGYKFEP